ncbi:nucleolin 2-like [Eucalyptus grandis]|uniref:nucleolin 2-like n=1 Tax=Eucalyptus grandis TaxID=71139 RepID=UPI00192E837E|nr:nucleolin 2-like [Eucalyptus grandis]
MNLKKDESAKKPTSAVPKKKVESSDDSDSESEEEEVVKKPAKSVSKKESSDSSSEDDSDSSSDDDDLGPPKKNALDVSAKRPRAAAQTKQTQQAKMDVDESDSEEDDSSEETDEEPQNKKDADTEMVDASPAPKAPMSEKKLQNPCHTSKYGLKDYFYFILQRDFFQAAGEVQDVRLAFDADERFKGFCHVEFTTAEAAQKVICHLIDLITYKISLLVASEAVEYNGEYLNDRQMRISLAHERGAYTPQSG